MDLTEDILTHPQQILSWYVAAGVDEATGEHPINRYDVRTQALAKREAHVQNTLQQAKPGSLKQTPSGPVAVRPAQNTATDEAIKAAVHLAQQAKTIGDIQTALSQFDACPLKKTAMNLVFVDGPDTANVMLIGDIPGDDEDRNGMPFVEKTGSLLDKMLLSIGIARSDVLVTNTIFWRPPGGRTPYDSEIAICLPFIERLIEIVDPKLLITLGGPATRTLLAQQGNISKLVGRWLPYETPGMSHPIQACSLYHPKFLLSSPLMKRQAWKNLLEIKAKLADL